MKVLCFGSLNIDMTFSVPHFVRGGETISSLSMVRSAGGKGANQAAALAKAGCRTYMAGKVGKDGLFILDTLKGYGVDCSDVIVTENNSGQAIIQLSADSQNAIILLPGENRNISKDDIDNAIAGFGKDDWIVLQNEINLVDYIIEEADRRGLSICYNPAPFDESTKDYPLELVDLLVVNEIEGAALAGIEGPFEKTIERLSSLYPGLDIIMTAGSNGAYYSGKAGFIYQPIVDYPVVDTTAAGDTFIGYYLASVISGCSVGKSLLNASKASGIAVSRRGAMESIPYRREVF